MESLKKVYKKVVFMLLVFAILAVTAVLLFFLKPKTAKAAGSLNFTLINNNTEYEVSKGDNISGEVVIPTTYNEKPVTRIANNAFFGCSGLISITIPNSVKNIGNDSFRNCSGLANIIIPDGIKSIENGTFYNCSGLKNITIPDSITSIGMGAFYNCIGLKSFTIPDGITNIEYNAFGGCIGLTNVTIPDKITSIGDIAFKGCTGLTGMVITNNIASIGFGAFQNCSSLKSITIPFVGNALNKTTNFHFGYIFGASDHSSNSSYVPSSLKTIIITGGNSIGDFSFFNCSGLTSITFPNSVKSIGSSAFRNCNGLENISVAVENLTYKSINDNCIIRKSDNVLILGCKNSVIPDYVTSIGDSAFFGCNELTSITIPDGVASIGNNTFYNCSGLTSITIPNSVTTIGQSAFWGCSGLTNITIGSGVISIDNYAFFNCSNLNIVYLAASDASLAADNVFTNTKSDLKIYVNPLYYNYYKNKASDWANYKDKIIAIDIQILINGLNVYQNEVYYYNTSQSIKIIYNIPISVKLNGVFCSDNFTVSKEGEYNLEVKDTTGDTSTYHFIIDKKPRIKYSGGKYFTEENNSVWLKITDLILEIENCDIPIITLNDDNAIAINNILTINSIKEGKYIIEVIGNEGISVSYTFYIDNTIPIVNGISDKDKITGGKTLTFQDNSDGNSYMDNYTRGQNIAKITLKSNTKQEYVNDNIDPTKTYSLPLESGDYTLIVTDKAENTAIINFFIYGKPQITGAENGKSYTSGVTLNFLDALGGNELKIVTINNGTPKNIIDFTNGNTYTVTFIELGIYTVRLEDNFGNQTEIVFTIVSELVPSLEEQLYIVTFVNEVPYSIVSGGIANTSIIINKKYPLKFLKIELEKDDVVIDYTFGSEIKDDGKYKATITNNEGYSADFEFTIITKVRNGFKYICPEGFEIEKYLINDIQQNIESLLSKTEINLKTDGKHDLTIWNRVTDERYRYVVTIDTVPPVLNFDKVNFNDGSPELRVVNNSVKLLSTEKKLSSLTVKLNDVEIEADIGTVFRQNGTYKVTAIDEVGNINTYEFVIEKKLDLLAFGLSSLGVVLVVILFGIIGHFRRKKQSIKAMM